MQRNPLSESRCGFVLLSLRTTETVWLTDEMLHIKLYEDGNSGTEEIDTGLAVAYVLLQGLWQGNTLEKHTRSPEVKNLHWFFHILNLLLPGTHFGSSEFICNVFFTLHSIQKHNIKCLNRNILFFWLLCRHKKGLGNGRGTEIGKVQSTH